MITFEKKVTAIKQNITINHNPTVTIDEYLIKNDGVIVGIIRDLIGTGDYRVFTIPTNTQVSDFYKQDLHGRISVEKIMDAIKANPDPLLNVDLGSLHCVVVTSNIGSKYYFAIDQSSGGYPWYPQRPAQAYFMTREKADKVLEDILNGNGYLRFNARCEELGRVEVMRVDFVPV